VSCSGVSTITSCAPTPSMRVNIPTPLRAVSPSMRRAGYLLDTTRTRHPGALAWLPSPRTLKISGGVCSSRPSQKGQRSRSAISSPNLPMKSVGRAARSVAIITQRRVMGSLRSSGNSVTPPTLLRGYLQDRSARLR